MSSIKYRKDIDGLRALAIIPVLLYHVGYSSFSGGYVGVDVFFVISGFLITKILMSDMNNGTYSLITFYERRIRRILPALTCVIIFVLCASPFFLAPDQYSFLGKEVVGTLLFSSNIVSFLKSGYFSTDAEQRPLLHTWSLGVEEQFYIVIPVILYFSFKYFREKINIILVILALISFLLSVMLTKIHPTSSFYLLHTRFWELCFGSLVAVGVIKPAATRYYREVLSAGGVMLILLATFTFTSKMVFPGFLAIIPVLGTALIILNAENTIAGKVLSLKPFVFIGLISYSLYLWHWPLIVFTRDKYIIDLSLSKEWLVIMSVLIAWFSTRFIESPFRNKKIYTRNKVFKQSAIAYSLLFIISMSILPLNGWTTRLDAGKAEILLATKDYSPARERCHFTDGVPLSERYCLLGTGKINPDLFVWGDSHLAEISYALSEHEPLYAATYSACPPVLDFISTERPSCHEHNKKVMEFILNSKDIKNVIISANYKKYEADDRYSGFLSGFNKTIEKLKNAGKKVIVLGQVPVAGVNVPYSLANEVRIINKTFIYDDSTFKKLKLDKNIIVFHFDDYLCKNGICSMLYEQHPISFDDNHLSLSVAKKMANYIIKLADDSNSQ
jgi:peptidoglycan/LPS O-acetylase OafA/YrhL